VEYWDTAAFFVKESPYKRSDTDGIDRQMANEFLALDVLEFEVRCMSSAKFSATHARAVFPVP
jgi:hypothetical protein